MATNTSLPSPASRRHADPSNKPKPPDIEVEIATDGDDAVVTVPGFGALAGVPACTLSGGAHAAPIPCLTATMNGLGTVTLHFAEAVANGDTLTWPERDTAIRGRTGAYVGPQRYTVSGSAPTIPALVSITWDPDSLHAIFVFDQDMIAAGPSIDGLVLLQSSDVVTLQADSIVDVTGPTVTVLMKWADPATPDMPDPVESTGDMSTVVVALDGGLAPVPFAHEPITENAAASNPILLNATGLPGGGNLNTWWNVAVNDNGGTHRVHQTDFGGELWSNSSGGANVTDSQTVQDENNDDGTSSAPPSTVTVDADTVSGVASGLGNLQFVDFPCPDV